MGYREIRMYFKIDANVSDSGPFWFMILTDIIAWLDIGFERTDIYPYLLNAIDIFKHIFDFRDHIFFQR